MSACPADTSGSSGQSPADRLGVCDLGDDFLLTQAAEVAAGVVFGDLEVFSDFRRRHVTTRFEGQSDAVGHARTGDGGRCCLAEIEWGDGDGPVTRNEAKAEGP